MFNHIEQMKHCTLKNKASIVVHRGGQLRLGAGRIILVVLVSGV